MDVNESRAEDLSGLWVDYAKMERASYKDELRRKHMSKKIMRCRMCGLYTLPKTCCPACGGNLTSPHPANLSLQDRYIDLRATLRRKIH